MEADFSGYATKAGLKCSDGRTIMPEAFQHSDGMTVPLVWQHAHSEPSNILGHAVLESRADGVYTYGYFNDSVAGKNAKMLVEHKDIVALSIYANQLIERSKQVFHGVIKEVSLVLSGANPGALIDNISFAHSDGEVDTLDDEAIIFTGLTLEHEDKLSDETVEHTDVLTPGDSPDPTVQEVYDTLTKEQQDVVNFMIGSAIESTQQEIADKASADKAAASHSDDVQHADNKTMMDANKMMMAGNKNGSPFPNKDMMDAKNTMMDASKNDTSASMLAARKLMTEAKMSKDMLVAAKAMMDATKSTLVQSDITEEHSDSNTNDEGDLSHKEGTDMSRNVFEQDGTKESKHSLSHEDVQGIVLFAQKNGSLKDAVEDYALQHGITNIGDMFPDATSVTNTPEFDKRRTEWVAGVISGTRHTPFSRIKSLSADLTFDAARAKGYIKGTMKKEEFFGIGKRVTTPTTIYKRQKLDRDDIIDITDFDVVSWLKFEMRFMLDEELARAVLVGDGRDVDDPDKINETNIRPISKDAELYATTVYVNLDDAASNFNEVVESILLARRFYKGSGTPNFYTTEETLTRMLLAKDNYGRRLYNNEAELALALRVSSVIAVPVMENEPNLVGIVVNLYDYTLGADKGGDVNLFDDFDIDYNQYKYMIETRVSGALTKIKAALVVRKTAAVNVLVEPVTPPTYVKATKVITVPTQTGVVYKIGAVTLVAGPQAAITVDTTVNAVPAAGYYFATNAADQWTFTIA